MSDYPSTLSGVNLWLDGRAQAYSDAAGAVPASAPLGRVARIDQPSPLSGSWLSPNTTDARPFREAGALRLEPVPTTGNYGGHTMNAPAGVTLPANACTISGSILDLTSPLVQPGTLRGIIYGIDGGGQGWGPFTINGELCIYYGGGSIWHTGITVPLFTQFSYVLRYSSTGLDLSYALAGVTQSPVSLTVAISSGTISTIALGAWTALNGIGNNHSVLQVVGVNRTVTNTERDGLLSWFATLTPPDPFPATSLRLTQSGDSIGANYGINAPDGCEYRSLTAIEAVFPDIRFLNLSVPTDSISGQAAKFSSVIAPLYSASCPLHIHVIQVVTNSIGSASIATIIAQTASLCDAAHALGGNVKVVVATCLPRGDGHGGAGFEADRQTYNTWVLTQSVSLGKADVVWDVCVTHMGAFGDSSNATYYQSDLVHPTAAGHALMAPGYQAAVLSLLPPVVQVPVLRTVGSANNVFLTDGAGNVLRLWS